MCSTKPACLHKFHFGTATLLDLKGKAFSITGKYCPICDFGETVPTEECKHNRIFTDKVFCAEDLPYMTSSYYCRYCGIEDSGISVARKIAAANASTSTDTASTTSSEVKIVSSEENKECSHSYIWNSERIVVNGELTTKFVCRCKFCDCKPSRSKKPAEVSAETKSVEVSIETKPNEVAEKPQILSPSGCKYATGLFFEFNERKVMIDGLPIQIVYPDPIYYTASKRSYVEGLAFALGFHRRTPSNVNAPRVYPVFDMEISTVNIAPGREYIRFDLSNITELKSPTNGGFYQMLIALDRDREIFRLTDYRRETNLFVIYMNMRRDTQIFYVSQAFLAGMMFGFKNIRERNLKGCLAFEEIWVTRLGMTNLLSYEECDAERVLCS